MKILKFLLLILSLLGLFGVFLPIASRGIFFVSIPHIGGISYLLYVVVVLLVILSVIHIYKEPRYIVLWFIITSIVGLVLTFLVTLVGLAMLENIASFGEKFYTSFQLSEIEAFQDRAKAAKSIIEAKNTPGLGSYLLGISFGGIIVISLIKKFLGK